MDEEYALLNERQQEQAESLTELALKFGKFDQTAGPDGSHYTAADMNPFKASGLICGNCVFWDDANGCQIVAGPIEAEAICKLWVIPGEMITEAQSASRSRLELKQRKLNLLK